MRSLRTRARVSISEMTGMPALGEELVGGFVAAPIGGGLGPFADDEAFDVGFGGFVVGGSGPVVADLRIGEDDDLAGVGGVCEDFLVAGE